MGPAESTSDTTASSSGSAGGTEPLTCQLPFLGGVVDLARSETVQQEPGGFTISSAASRRLPVIRPSYTGDAELSKKP